MKLSFRYRFVVSFVVLEILFLSMIAIVNFTSLENNSKRLIDEKIKSLTSLGSELIITPLSVYDVATLDNILLGLSELKGVESLKLYDTQGKELSSVGKEPHESKKIIKVNKKIVYDTIKLGELDIWLDLSENYAELSTNRDLTYFIILLEIFASTVIAFFIGYRLSGNLEKLTTSVHKIGQEGGTSIPVLKGNDEITELANAMTVMQDRINERNESLKKVNVKLQNSIQILREYEHAVNEGSILSRGDLNGKITYVNHSFCEVTGYSRDELIDQPHNIIRHPNTPRWTFKKMWNTLHKGEIWHGLLKNIRKNGTSFYVDITIVPIRNHDNKVVEYLALRQDVTELVKRSERLRRPFQTDLLTSLGNRSCLFENVKSLEKPYLALIDIRGFKEINEQYGHDIGDEVIREVGERLFRFFDNEYYLSFRINVDEFAVLCDGTSLSKDNFIDTVQKFQQDIESNMFKVMENEFYLILTTGIAFENKKDIVSNVSLVHQMAKQKNMSYLVYRDDIKKSNMYKNNLLCVKKLMTALQSDRLIGYYQPIINNVTGKIERYETLARLKEEDGTIVSPYSFIDVSRKARLYPQISRKMIDICLDAIDTYEQGFSVNISGDDLSNEKTMSYLYSRLNECKQGHKLTFEILESESINSYDALEHFLNKIRGFGCKVALDDFGTGYSNFDYIIKMNPDYLKIDGSLIENVHNNKNTYNVVVSIVQFAQANDIVTVAEYVSDESIYKTVCELGIDYSQGYFFGKAEPEPLGGIII